VTDPFYRTPVVPGGAIPRGSAHVAPAARFLALVDRAPARADGGATTRRLERLRAYYRGEQDTWPLHSEGAREAFGRTFSG